MAYGANNTPYTAMDLKTLKDRVNAEMRRRQYTGSMISYDKPFTVIPVSGNVISATNVNEIVNPLIAVNSDVAQSSPYKLSPINSGSVYPDLTPADEYVATLETIKPANATNHGCKLQCSGLCRTICTITCGSDGCSTSCTIDGCNTACKGSGQVVTCSDCSSTGCSYGCNLGTGGCSDCASDCSGYCEAGGGSGCGECSSGCSSGCTPGDCSVACSNGCGDNCEGCGGWCQSSSDGNVCGMGDNCSHTCIGDACSIGCSSYNQV